LQKLSWVAHEDGAREAARARHNGEMSACLSDILPNAEIAQNTRLDTLPGNKPETA
jgi:hypothetical protein